LQVSLNACEHIPSTLWVHLLHCAHGNKRMGTHDVVHDTFAAIARDVGFHMVLEQLHALPSTMVNSFCQQVDIVFTKDDICTLANVVIIDPMWTNLLSRFCVIQRFVAFNAIQAKEKSYCDWHLPNQILPLGIEVFGYLYKQVDMFSHHCANAIWSLKGPKGLHLSILVTFICQKVSITLQRMQASSILSRV